MQLLAGWAHQDVSLARGTHHRRNQAALYLHGDYVPLVAQGAINPGFCAFARLHIGTRRSWPLLRVFLRAGKQNGLLALYEDPWQDTSVMVPQRKAGSVYHHLFTGERFETT